jgi:ATP-dependent DNA helicase UvrD/PcrA
MIRCGHCGGAHATVAEVRSCSGGDTSARSEPMKSVAGEPAKRVGRQRPAHVALDPSFLDTVAGPPELGRWLIIEKGEAVHPAWADAERLMVDHPEPSPELLQELTIAHHQRDRLVIEAPADMSPAPEPLEVPWWELTPDLSRPGERLAHLLGANAVDTRGGQISFGPIEAALAAGATLGSITDVVLPDGTPAWCDGGPLTWFDGIDRPVVPACNLARAHLRPIGSGQPDADLAPDQLQAVSHDRGSARIIAPAGSGKTRVLTERVRHLVRERHIDPGAICLVAFNVRAREEMQQRTRDLTGIEVRTLNSLALAICNGTGPFVTPRRHGRVTVVDEPQVRRLLDEIVTVRRQAMADPMAAWIEALTASRLGLRAPALVEADFGSDVRDFANIAPQYVALLHERGLVDFDQQILRAIEVLLSDPDALATARRSCRQLLVDEFQDLTPAHVLLVRLLAGPAGEVFGVGDDDQTIYGYSGASPEWLIGFDHLFPGAGHHDLHINYRCPPDVVEAASNLVSHGRRRVDKIISARPGHPAGSGLTQTVSDDPAAALVQHVTSLLEKGVSNSDIAVLTRVNATLLAPFVALSSAEVATTKPIDTSFLDRTGIAGALAWIELATAPSKRLPGSSIGLAARRPPRALNPRVIDWMAEKRSTSELAELARRMNAPKDTEKVSSFVDHVELVRRAADEGTTTRGLLEAVRDQVGLGQALDKRLDASRRAVDRSSHSDDLSALLAISNLHPDPGGFVDWLTHQLADLPHVPGGVRLSTVHRVKGLEWPHVVVYDATAGLFPHRLAESTDEERRVFHVAITRCSAGVHLISGRPPSRFITELDRARDPSVEPDPEPASREPPSRRARPVAAPPASTIEVASLREKLRSWRAARAKADAVPAFVVFSDATLYELAERRPQSPAELLSVKGIGPSKLDKYGGDILDLLIV